MKPNENQFQWMAILITVFGLFMTAYYNHKTLKVAKFENELISHLNLSERYHQILYTLLKNDPDVFQKTDSAALEKNKFLIYEAIDLFCTVYSLEKYHEEMVHDIWPQWHKRMLFFFEKPAVQFAWESQNMFANNIYNQAFIEEVDKIVSRPNYEDQKLLGGAYPNSPASHAFLPDASLR